MSKRSEAQSTDARSGETPDGDRAARAHRAEPEEHAVGSESDTTLERGTVRISAGDRDQPTRVGRYHVARELGRGGMGVVYLAEQHEPVRRQVALKLLHQHKGGRHRERFREECQTLARMRHPNIAQVLDAGETDEDNPFLVLEYIDGLSLTEFADRERLSLVERLELFMKVCDGIQHAHQKGVIHRDLKPSNILVALHGSQAVPKVIDFGVAKQIDSARDLTRAGQLVGSPSHMSPEQLQGAAADVDTRADVYALGNVLYELLSGTMVYLTASGSFFDYMVQVSRGDPQPMSLRCTALGDTAESIAACRGLTAAALAQQLRGDLDAIVLKALAKERDDRYPSASGLAADLRRHLDGLPVIAHPGGRGYQLRKLMRRHRVEVVATLAVTLALAVATTMTGLSLGRARTAEKATQQSAAQTQTVNRILEEILSSPDPALDGSGVTLISVLDRTAEQVTRDLEDQPQVAASLLHVLGRTYGAVGAHGKATTFLSRALGLRTEHQGPAADDTLATRAVLVRTHLDAGALPEAESLAREHLGLSGSRSPDLTATHHARLLLGEVLYVRGRYSDAERELRAAYDALSRRLGRSHEDTLRCHLALGKVLGRRGQIAAAEAIFESAHDVRAQRLGTDHPDTLEVANLLGNVYYTSRRYEAAERQYRETVERASARFDEKHPYLLMLRMNLGNAIYKLGAYGEAESLFREVLAIQRQTLGKDHPSTMLTLNNLGNALRRQSKLQEAETVYREAMQRQRSILGRGHDETLRTTLNLLKVLDVADRHAPALALVEEMLEEHPRSPDLWSFKALLEAELGRVHTATEAAERAVAIDPESDERALKLAHLLALSDRGEEAWAVFQQVLGRAKSVTESAAIILEGLDPETRSAFGAELVSRLREAAGTAPGR